MSRQIQARPHVCRLCSLPTLFSDAHKYECPWHVPNAGPPRRPSAANPTATPAHANPTSAQPAAAARNLPSFRGIARITFDRLRAAWQESHSVTLLLLALALTSCAPAPAQSREDQEWTPAGNGVYLRPVRVMFDSLRIRCVIATRRYNDSPVALSCVDGQAAVVACRDWARCNTNTEAGAK